MTTQKDTRARVQFFLGGSIFRSRRMHHIPRVGDEFVEGEGVYRVERVIWGVESDDERRFGFDGVNIELVEESGE